MGIFDSISSQGNAALSYIGQRNANRMNQGTAREQMAFQRESNATAMAFSNAQTAKQMAFQERMAGSEHQRGMADMRAAGLNPILAYSKGGASSPGGASASGVSSGGARAEMRNQLEGVANSAISIAKAQEELSLLKNQNKNIKAQTQKTYADTKNVKQTNTMKSPIEKIMGTTSEVMTNSAKSIRTGWNKAKSGERTRSMNYKTPPKKGNLTKKQFNPKKNFGSYNLGD